MYKLNFYRLHGKKETYRKPRDRWLSRTDSDVLYSSKWVGVLINTSIIGIMDNKTLKFTWGYIAI